MAKANVIPFPLTAMAVNERAIKQRAAKRERTIGSKGYEDCRTELLDAHMRLMRIHFDGLPVAEWDIWQRKVGEAAGHRLLF